MKKPLSTITWCIILFAITVLLFLGAYILFHKNSISFQLCLACTTGVAASSVVTFFVEHANRNQRRYLCSVYLKELHMLVESMVLQNEQICGDNWQDIYKRLKYNFRPWLYDELSEEKIEKERVEFTFPALVISDNFDRMRETLANAVSRNREYLSVDELECVLRIQSSVADIKKLIEEYAEVNQELSIGQFIMPKRMMFQRYLEKQNVKVKIDIDPFLQDLLAHHADLLSQHDVGEIVELMTLIMQELYRLMREFIGQGFVKTEKELVWDAII